MSPAASPTRSARPRASVEPRLAQREPIAAQLFEVVEGSAVRLAEPAEMGPETRSLLLPAADAEIRVVALGEDPAVAARNDAQLEREPPVIRRAIHLRVGQVRLERDADDAVAAEPERARGHPVDAVRADQEVGFDPFDGHTVRPNLEVAHLHAFTELGPRLDRLLHEEVVEALPLRHVDERVTVSSGDGLPVAQAQVHGRDDVLDDGLDGEGQEPRGTARHASATRLVARKACAVEQEDVCTRAREPVGGRRACGAGADDDGVVALHGAILTIRGTRAL